MSAGRIATVFGGTGFLGHAIVQALAARGYVVRVPTRDITKADDMKLMGAVGQIVPLRVCARTDSAAAQAMRGASIVINLIGELFESRKNSFQTTHVEMAARLARLAKAEGVTTYVHVSAFGADVQSASRYARTKALGEQAVRAFFPDAVILRPSVMFGPRDKFFNRFALMARYLPFLPLIGGGHTKFQPVYVGDVAAFLVAALDRLETRGRVYALGGPQVYTFREMMELLLQTMGRRRWLAPVPWWLAQAKALFFEMLPNPPLTRDQIELLKVDHVIANPPRGSKPLAYGTLASLGITPTPLEAVLPSYVARL